VQKSFTSWRDFSRNYLVGHEFRAPFLSDESALDFYGRLDFLRFDPESPWNKNRWKVPFPSGSNPEISSKGP
jgi:hypothetical protein